MSKHRISKPRRWLNQHPEFKQGLAQVELNAYKGQTKVTEDDIFTIIRYYNLPIPPFTQKRLLTAI